MDRSLEQMNAQWVLERLGDRTGWVAICDAMAYALALGCITHTAVVDEFGISRGTLSRWIRGTVTPHAHALPFITSWLRDALHVAARGAAA